MRFGCCLNMVAQTPDGIGLEHLAAAKKAGFDYVELPLAELMALEERRFQSAADRIHEVGLPCEACNNFFPKGMRLTGPAADHTAALEYVKRALRRAAALGAETVVFGSGPAKMVPTGFPLEEGLHQVAVLLQEVAPIAEENGIVIAIEPLRKAECNLVNSYEEGCALADMVDRRQIRVLVDYFHLIQEKEPETHIKTGGHWLAHVHFARPEGRIYPADGDGHDYTAFIGAVKGAGYNGRVSCEAYSHAFGRDAQGALSLLRRRF